VAKFSPPNSAQFCSTVCAQRGFPRIGASCRLGRGLSELWTVYKALQRETVCGQTVAEGRPNRVKLPLVLPNGVRYCSSQWCAILQYCDAELHYFPFTKRKPKNRDHSFGPHLLDTTHICRRCEPSCWHARVSHNFARLMSANYFRPSPVSRLLAKWLASRPTGKLRVSCHRATSAN